MKHAAWIALAVLGSCASPPERPRFPGVRAYLVLLDPSPAVGTPLRIRLDLINDTDADVLYDDQQSASSWSYEVLGPDGKPVQSVDGPRSTFGTYHELAPRSSVTLIEERDLTSPYLITKPGRYTIRFWGTIRIVDAARYAQLEKDMEKDDTIDYFERVHALEGSVDGPSNVVTAEVRPGTAPEKWAVAEKVLAALPEGWEFAIDWWPPQTEDPEYTLFGPNRKKGDPVIVFRLSKGPPLERETKVGEASGKTLYVRSSPELEKLWPGHRRRLLEILNGR